MKGIVPEDVCCAHTDPRCTYAVNTALMASIMKPRKCLQAGKILSCLIRHMHSSNRGEASSVWTM